MKRVLFFISMIPIWLLQLFTQTKSFKANPFIGSRLLNILGLHVLRLCLSHAIFKLRLLIVMPKLEAEQRQFFKKHGYLIVPHALPPNEFNLLQAEIREYQGEVREQKQGTTSVLRLFLNRQTLPKLPQCNALMFNANMMNPLRYCAARFDRPRAYIEQLHHHYYEQGKEDPQKNMHSDTFHPTMKAWLFIDDVTSANGPFTYIPGSHKLSWRRLKWEYRKSILAKHANDGYSEKGSFRPNTEDLRYLKLPEPMPVQVPANSLVIANTYGFHCRGQNTAPKASRLAVWFSNRTNPFNPWPGLPWRWAEQNRDSIYVGAQKVQDWWRNKKGKKYLWKIQQTKGFFRDKEY